MIIVADENMPLVAEYFGSLGTVRRVNGRQLRKQDLMDADVLLVRSVTAVNKALLDGTPVRFVGTATIGTDHIDTDWLVQQGIRFAAAPGCNAASVVQYVLSLLVLHAQFRHLDTLTGLKAGIVGAGNVGGRLAATLEALGVEVVVSDPPREAAGAATAGRYGRLDEVLDCDLVSLHTPLTRSGPCPTFHLLAAPQLAGLRAGQLLVNSGRGPVIDNAALQHRLSLENPPTVALDVWEWEPAVTSELASRCWLGTPHIAGYSLEGKSRGTDMIYRALCSYLGQPPAQQLEGLLPPAPVYRLQAPDLASPVQALTRSLLACYDPREDDARFRLILALPDQAQREAFDALRRNYPVRREPSSVALEIEGGPAAVTGPVARALKAAGFPMDSAALQ